MCEGELNVENATTDWDAVNTYQVNSSVTATCNDGYLAEGNVTSMVVLCTIDGWGLVVGCYEVCMTEPPPAGENMTRRNYNWTGVGAIIFYDCQPNTLLKQYGVNGERIACFDYVHI